MIMTLNLAYVKRRIFQYSGYNDKLNEYWMKIVNYPVWFMIFPRHTDEIEHKTFKTMCFLKIFQIINELIEGGTKMTWNLCF